VRLAPDEADEIRDVQVLFQYGRPVADGERPVDRRTKARLVCAVVDESEVSSLVDVTEPSRPQLLHPKAALLGRKRAARGYRWTGLALRSHVDLAEVQGGSRTRERDYVYLARELDQGADRRSSILVFDVSDPESPRFAGETGAGQGSETPRVSAFYNPPFLQTIGWTPSDAGLFMTDLTISAAPRAAAMLPGIRSARAVAIEEFPFDRMLDEADRPLKDVSHRDSRWLELPEIARVLAVDGERLGTIAAGAAPSEPPGASARLFLAQFDVDGSGALEGEECERARAVSLDPDGDGRVTLLELGASGRVLATDGGPTSPMTSMQDAAQAENDDGELAKLLDGVDPFAFDANKDGRLEREEFARAYFAALDLDGDKALSRDEVSRRPGAARTLALSRAPRRRRASRRSTPAATARSRRASSRSSRPSSTSSTATATARSAWSTRRATATASRRPRAPPSGPSAGARSRRCRPRSPFERILAQFDADHDGTLVRARAQDRPDFMREMDKDVDKQADVDRARDAGRARARARRRRLRRRIRAPLGPRRRRQGRGRRAAEIRPAGGASRAQEPLSAPRGGMLGERWIPPSARRSPRCRTSGALAPELLDRVAAQAKLVELALRRRDLLAGRGGARVLRGPPRRRARVPRVARRPRAGPAPLCGPARASRRRRCSRWGAFRRTRRDPRRRQSSSRSARLRARVPRGSATLGGDGQLAARCGCSGSWSASRSSRSPARARGWRATSSSSRRAARPIRSPSSCRWRRRSSPRTSRSRPETLSRLLRRWQDAGVVRATAASSRSSTAASSPRSPTAKTPEGRWAGGLAANRRRLDRGQGAARPAGRCCTRGLPEGAAKGTP
jgi:hypothetical protein